MMELTTDEMELIVNDPELNTAVILWAGCSESIEPCSRCAGDQARDTSEGPMCLGCYMALPACFGCKIPAIGSLHGKPLCRSCWAQRMEATPRMKGSTPWGRKDPKCDREPKPEMSWERFSKLLTTRMIANGFLDTYQLRLLKRHRGVDFDA